ncbi:uncharacterized protein LOC132722241 [Ruditapes philippinarum]|uniref:uncharacterized protein LOC132722241 n=1 Tax=Ruditapes philippinarum TaxID=129788 RepID=UPI00295C1601|nr:uncharacterized protein LOC132722241 [Ruditapes philippinarum]
METKEIKKCVIIKCIIVGILKSVCLYKGYNHSDLHSGLTFYSFLFDILSIVLSCNKCIEREMTPPQKGIIPVSLSLPGVVTKAIATFTTYYKRIEEIKMMCSLCLVIEVFLVALLTCCCLCNLDEAIQTRSKLKQTA